MPPRTKDARNNARPPWSTRVAGEVVAGSMLIVGFTAVWRVAIVFHRDGLPFVLFIALALCLPGVIVLAIQARFWILRGKDAFLREAEAFKARLGIVEEKFAGDLQKATEDITKGLEEQVTEQFTTEVSARLAELRKQLEDVPKDDLEAVIRERAQAVVDALLGALSDRTAFTATINALRSNPHAFEELRLSLIAATIRALNMGSWFRTQDTSISQGRREN
jgi:hypothetical protein